MTLPNARELMLARKAELESIMKSSEENEKPVELGPVKSWTAFANGCPSGTGSRSGNCTAAQK